MSSPSLKACIYCKGKVERLIGAGGGLIFKGSGFYATDYRKKEPAAAEKKDSPKKESAPPETFSKSKSTESKSAETKSTDRSGQ